MTIDELYGEHAKAFEQAGYSVEFPTLGKANDDRIRKLEKKKARLEEEGTNQADDGGGIRPMAASIRSLRLNRRGRGL